MVYGYHEIFKKNSFFLVSYKIKEENLILKQKSGGSNNYRKPRNKGPQEIRAPLKKIFFGHQKLPK